MIDTLIRMICCAAGGAAAGFGATLWIRKLQKDRGLEYSLTKGNELCLIAVSAAAGGAIGVLTTGIGSALCAILLLGISEAISVIDWNNRVIPNQTVLAVFGVKILSVVTGLLEGTSLKDMELWQSLLGMLACFLVFSFPGILGKKVGAGDVKLAAAMDFLLGTYSSLLGIVIMGLMILAFSFMQGKVPLMQFFKTNIPMGPFITVGMMAAFVGAPLLF